MMSCTRTESGGSSPANALLTVPECAGVAAGSELFLLCKKLIEPAAGADSGSGRQTWLGSESDWKSEV